MAGTDRHGRRPVALWRLSGERPLAPFVPPGKALLEEVAMGLILMLLGLAVLLMAFQGVVLAYMWRESRGDGAPPADASARVPPSQFFGTAARPTHHGVDAVPIDVLLQHLEQHIRLEQAAAESYHSSPTVAALHKQTTSPLLH
jgi:hypothetical protein